ncbi:MAG: hypothetical protein ABEJ65_04860 [bacterium]
MNSRQQSSRTVSDFSEIKPNKLIDHCRLSDLPGSHVETEVTMPVWAVSESDFIREVWSPRGTLPSDSPLVLLQADSEIPNEFRTLKLWTQVGSISDLEKGLVLNYLEEKLDYNQQEIFNNVLEILEIPRSEVWYETFTFMVKLPERLRKRVHENGISRSFVRYLKDVKSPLKKELIDHITEGTLTVSTQQMRQISEATRRIDDDNLSRCIDDLKSIVQSSNNARKSGERVLNYLREKAFPRLMERRQNFKKELEKLDINGRITIDPPENFEGDYLDVSLRCKRDDDLESLSEAVRTCKPLLKYV